jgi:hypothetical protein
MAAGPVVGFYGCHVLGRTVRVRPPAEGLLPRSATFECPCGNQHQKAIAWRSLREDEELASEVDVG